MNSNKTYKNLSWNNQIIGKQTINLLNIRFLEPPEQVTLNDYRQLIDTDGRIMKKQGWGPHIKYIKDYSYVILSTGILENPIYSRITLKIDVYLKANFDISLLQNIDDFLGKSYLLEACDQSQNTDLVKPEPDLFKYLKKKVGDDEYKNFYSLLQESAKTGNFAFVESLFKDYAISDKYRAIFWKKMYLSKW